VDGNEWHAVDSISISGLEVKAAAKDVWLKSCLMVQGDNVAAKMAAAPDLLNDSDLCVADESWADEEL